MKQSVALKVQQICRQGVFTGSLLCAALLASETAFAHSLPQAVKLALSNNPEVLSAQQKIGVAMEQLDQAKAGWMPTVDLALDVGREFKRSEGGDPTAMTKNITSITLNQPLFDGGATSASVERKDLMQQISAVQFDEIRTAVTLSAIEAWHELFRLQRVIKLMEVNVEDHHALFMQIKQKVEAGGAGEAELVAAETPWLLAQSALIKTKGEYQDALAQYTAVVGVKPVEILTSGIDLSDEMLPLDLNEAIERMLQDNYILRSAELNLMAAKADHRGSRAELLPSLNFELKGGRKQNDGGLEGVDVDSTALIKLNYNLFNGGASESRRRETARGMLDSQEQLSLAHRKMAEQLARYWNGIEVSRKLLVTSHHQLKISEGNYRAAEEQFKLGEGDVMAIMAAADAVLAAKKSVLNDQIDLHMGRYRLLSHMGQLLDHIETADVVLVMEEIREDEIEGGEMGWVDRLVGRDIELLASQESPASASSAVDYSANQWGGTMSTLREAGWVVLNAKDEIEGVTVRAPAPGKPSTRFAGRTEMALVGGTAGDGAAFQKNRAEQRRLELEKRLGRYSRESQRYQKRLEQQEVRLGLSGRRVESAADRYNQRLALRTRMSRGY